MTTIKTKKGLFWKCTAAVVVFMVLLYILFPTTSSAAAIPSSPALEEQVEMKPSNKGN
jgi:hypothetical protein